MKKWILLISALLVCVPYCALAISLWESDDTLSVRDAVSIGSATESNLPVDRPSTPWVLDKSIFNEDQGDRIEEHDVSIDEVKTVKLTDLVPPIHFAEGEIEIPAAYLVQLRNVLESMGSRKNVRLHFIGHTDSTPLSPRLENIYVDNQGLSRERAGQVAEYCQDRLSLPPEAISYEGAGDSVPVADNGTPEGRADNRRVEVEVWYDEIGTKKVTREIIVPRNVSRVKICRTETVCKLRYPEGHARRAVIKNLFRPLHYRVGELVVTDRFIEQLSEARSHLAGKNNLMVKVIAYTDNASLVGREKRIYGDSLGLSKAVARRVAQVVQDELQLPNSAIQSVGRGAQRPVSDNLTPRGRALNRRVEIEFWYDDPLQELPGEPQICPDAALVEKMTRVYQPADGGVPDIHFSAGDPVIPEAALARMGQLLAELSDRENARLRFIGYTSNKRLSRRTAAIYGDDIGWSTARARRAMDMARESLGLSPGQVEFEGRGYVRSEDLVNTGFIESETSHVEVQAVYDEPVSLDDYEGIEITPLVREVETRNPYGLNLMRISVDGQPVDDPGKSSADVQRCTDVALGQAQVQFKHDSIDAAPRLNVTAWPHSVGFEDVFETGFIENRVTFRLYSNYRSFIDHGEIRIFRETQAVSDEPLRILPLDESGQAHWNVDLSDYQAPGIVLKYLVRVYDSAGRFDETRPQPLWIVDQQDAATLLADPGIELLAGYGETRIAEQGIPLRGGTVGVLGRDIPDGYQVWFAGYPVPVAKDGSFVAEQILPGGLHTVEVAVLDRDGSGDLFLRDLELEKSDWFTVGIADLTASANETNGPANLLDPDNPRYSEDASLQGRLAFFTKGKFENGWSLTASADTREGPLDEIFSNFMEKTSEAQFRRMDADKHYPTFGDDSTVIENAPTRGKFYTRVEKDKTYGLWGNFRIAYLDNEIAQVDRELYGANLHYQEQTTTSFGEPRLVLDGFSADPGTVSARDDFRGTGGSLYYLKQQDILEGSETLRIEVRDKDSGMVLATKTLAAELDYDIDYLQGRILLTEVLPTVANDDLLVSTSSVSGNPVFLVARYEYTPGFDEPDTMVNGGRAAYWLNDYVKIGVNGNWEDEEGISSNLIGTNIILRKSAGTWLKVQGGHSEGPPEESTRSIDGGYTFTETSEDISESVEADAYRVDGSIDLSDFISGWPARSTFYLQQVEEGYSAPGQYTENNLIQYGTTVQVPIAERARGTLKYDRSEEDEGLLVESAEGNVDYTLSHHWTVSTGVRVDSREDNSAVVASTQEEGERTDAVVRVSYDSTSRWTGYSFVQQTVKTTGDRYDNDRVGVGGSWRMTDRFKLLGEVSHGDLGTGASLGSEYLYSDRTTIYNTYALDNERSDNGVKARKGTMISGFRTRYSDAVSFYLEEKYAHGTVPTGLVHSTGIELVPTDRWNLSTNLDYGTLKDPETAAELERTSVAFNVGYGLEQMAVSSGLEYRVDNTEQSDGSFRERTSWLFKNNFRYQLNPDWRMIGKLNYSQSHSNSGAGYDSDYTEAVVGYAYRPVAFDRLNMLFKYTFFYNLPGSDAASSSDGSYVQRSHILAADAMFDLTRRWTVGGKYAYRLGQVALDSENPDYFDSRAQLCVLRADWHFIHRWDALVELRNLDLPDAGDNKSGVLVAAYRHMGEHVKLGVGYNFSDFSDDLTQLDYRHQGLFVNLLGKF